MAAIETAVSGTVIFASSTGNHYIITLDHVVVFLTTRSTSLVQKAGGHGVDIVSFRTRDRYRDAHTKIALLFLSLQHALAFMDFGFGR